jgi:UDP-2,3-diacylglucosamine hydrolase
VAALFISDLHIDASRPAITEQFLSFLGTEARDAEALYILGDLFESWIGDDAPDAAQTAAIAGIHALTTLGVPCFVMHGDALCTDDRAYQRLRATVREPSWQRQFLGLSAKSRRALAGAARVGSQAHTAALEYAIADVNAASVAAALRSAGTATLLHGHTHRPAIHALQVDGRSCTRIVLGDWYDQGSLLRWDQNGPELASLSR